MRGLFNRFLCWFFKPFLTAILDNYDLRLREYLKLKFEHTESELEVHDSRILSAVAHTCAEVRAEVQNIHFDFEAFVKELNQREIQNRAELAVWLTPKFQQLEARILRIPFSPNHEPPPPEREPKEFTWDERQ